MLKNLLQTMDSAQATAMVAFFVSVIVTLFKMVKPLWEKKIKAEKNNHVKQALELGLSLANTIVPEMAVMEALSKSDRKKEGIRFVNSQLQAHGITLDIQTISGLIERAYQAYKQTGGDNHLPKATPAIPENTPVEPVIDKPAATPTAAPEKGDK